MRRLYLSTLVLSVATALSASLVSSSGNPVSAEEKGRADKADADAAAVARARATVQMLDDLYKNFVVNITATYVSAEENIPAAKVAMKVFQAMHKKGWHKARLIDATGSPVRKANLPQTDFERTAVAYMKSGKTYYDEIAQENGRKVLRAATIVPVVMKQCITCHQGKKQGELIGAIVYELPIK